MRLDDPRLRELAAATRGLSAVVSFVEESADHRLFIAAASWRTESSATSTARSTCPPTACSTSGGSSRRAT